MAEQPYLPVSLGDAVVGKIKINEDGSFDGQFHPDFVELMRVGFEEHASEVVVVGRAAKAEDPVDIQMQFRHFLEELAKRQKEEGK